MKRNKRIIICKADKGNCIVVLDKDEYIRKAKDILNQKQFEKTDKSLREEKEKELNKYIRQLQKEKVIDKQLYWLFHSTSSSLATMYGLPKVHKANYPLRPIISSVGSYNYQLAKYLADLINKNKTEKSFSYIKDSFAFVKKIIELPCSKNQVMLSFDVDNLYTNVPVKEAIDITLDLLFKKGSPASIPFNRDQLKHLLELAVCNIPFRFLDETYIQKDGVAMGSPLGPILADIFMSNLEKKLNKFSSNKPALWIRYVDDVFCIFTVQQNISDFFSRINRWHPNIRFTKEDEVDKKLAFLDVLVLRDETNDKYTTTLYRKPTNTNLYLLFESNQCRRYKIGLIRTLTIRILRICSNDEQKQIELTTMKKTLINNGYPYKLILRGIKEGEYVVKRSTDTVNKDKDKTETKSVFLSFSFHGNESAEFAKKVKKLIKKYLPLLSVNIAFRKTLTLRKIFLPIQKGIDVERKDKKVVYKICCLDCDFVYIGATNRQKHVRMKEHQKDIRNFSENSNVAKHVIDKKHTFDFAGAQTLTYESNWNRRVIKESLYTSDMKGKSLNDVKFKLNVFN